MNPVFADTFYFIALLNPADTAHKAAVRYSKPLQWPLVTTGWVVTELADAFARADRKATYLEAYDVLRNNPQVTIVPATPVLFEAGMELYRSRADKDWSLTDCISFVVMKERNITQALTGDRHFEQAGFKTLLG